MKFSKITFISITALAIMSSCKKDKINVPPIAPAIPPVTIAQSTAAVLKFDGDLLDSAGKINTSGIVGITSYGADRKGNPAGALYLNGSTSVQWDNLDLKGKSMTMCS